MQQRRDHDHARPPQVVLWPLDEPLSRRHNCRRRDGGVSRWRALEAFTVKSRTRVALRLPKNRSLIRRTRRLIRLFPCHRQAPCRTRGRRRHRRRDRLVETSSPTPSERCDRSAAGIGALRIDRAAQALSRAGPSPRNRCVATKLNSPSHSASTTRSASIWWLERQRYSGFGRGGHFSSSIIMCASGRVDVAR